MWNTIQEWLNALPVSEEIIKSALMSVVMIVAVIAGRSILLSAHFRSHPDLSIENKRRSLVVSRNITILLLLFGLAMIWAAQIQTLALSMFAVAAAIVVATKELIMCLSGSILRSVTKQYSIGDYIEINSLRGRVVDINMLNTLMMQIPVPIHLDSDEIIGRLKDVLEPLCEPYVPAIKQHLENVQTQKLFITPAAQPRVSRVPHDDKVYNIIVRFASPVAKRLEIQQAVLDEFLRTQYQLINKLK